MWWCLRECGGMLGYPTLSLLNPFEYFVTVNHSGLWQRHVAWAKPGKQATCDLGDGNVEQQGCWCFVRVTVFLRNFLSQIYFF
jgi:hypothetical protein